MARTDLFHQGTKFWLQFHWASELIYKHLQELGSINSKIRFQQVKQIIALSGYWLGMAMKCQKK